VKTLTKWLDYHGYDSTRYGEKDQYLKAEHDRNGNKIKIQHRGKYNMTMVVWDSSANVRVTVRQKDVRTLVRILDKYHDLSR